MVSAGIIRYETIMSPDSWMNDDDVEFCFEILNLKKLRELSNLKIQQPTSKRGAK